MGCDTTPPTWTLGDRLRKAREHAGYGQAELAAAIGVSRNTISNYEQDRHPRRPPKLPYLRAWADATGVPLPWLLGQPGARRATDVPNPPPAASNPFREPAYA